MDGKYWMLAKGAQVEGVTVNGGRRGGLQYTLADLKRAFGVLFVTATKCKGNGTIQVLRGHFY